MRKILIALSVCIILLVTGGNALAQGGGVGFFDFVTDVRLHGLVYVLNDIVVTDDVTAEDVIVTDPKNLNKRPAHKGTCSFPN